MPYSLTIKPPVLFASWRGYTPSELREVADRLAEVRRSSGRPVAYIAQLPASGHVFTESDQGVLLGFLQTILPSCATIHHIIEGDGFLKSGRLAIVATLAQSTPRPRDFYTHATLEEGARSIKSLYGVNLEATGSTAPEPPPERASGAFREAARIVEGRRTPPRKG
jgi:hypothetical protein